MLVSLNRHPDMFLVLLAAGLGPALGQGDSLAVLVGCGKHSHSPVFADVLEADNEINLQVT